MAAVTVAELMRTAMQHHQAGQLDQAEVLYRQIIALDPNHADALHLLGVLAYQANEENSAIELISRAIQIKGEWPTACFHLGLAFQQSEQFDQAIAAFRRVVALDPAFPQAHYYLGVVLQIAGQRDKAIAAYTKAVALKPDDAVSHINLGIALQAAGKLDEAIESHRRAIAASPNLPDAHFSLGSALQEKGQFAEAIDAFRHGVALKGDEPQAYIRLSAALWESDQIDAAIAALQQALALNPNDPEVHCAYAQLLLLRGDFSRGWSEFEWRWRRKASPWPRRKFPQPLWDGSDLAGRTILLHGEQSCSDTIQFIRFIPLVQRRGGRVIVECQPGLRTLLEENWAVDQWLSPGEPLPPFDVYCPLLSLPRIFGTTLQSIPGDLPHWRPADELIDAWRKKIAPTAPGLKIGLAWAGSPSQLNDRKRSMPLSILAPLAEITGVEFYSLQKGQAASQAANPPAAMQLRDFADHLTDFADTAALISQLDLIISVDTAVAHLAGAMGKKVWTMLPAVLDWRWMLDREDTPWYPTMRLFRQPSPGDWDSVIRRVAEELTTLAASSAAGRHSL